MIICWICRQFFERSDNTDAVIPADHSEKRSAAYMLTLQTSSFCTFGSITAKVCFHLQVKSWEKFVLAILGEWDLKDTCQTNFTLDQML